jgi:type IV secretion system protein VirB3
VSKDYGTPIHESLNRPILLMGGERNLVLMLAIIAGVFIFSLAHVWAAAIGITMWTLGQWGLSRAAAYDPQLSQTGVRSLKYKRYYPAQATPFAPHREIQ